MKKVVLITNIPTPYRVPLFNELSEALKVRGVQLHVIFGAATYARRKFVVPLSEFRFEYSILGSSAIQRKDVERTSFLYNGLSGKLKQLSPDAVIVSGFSMATWKVFLRSIFRRQPYYIWNGSVIDSYRQEGWLKRLFRKVLLTRATGFISYGKKAKEYLVQLGARPEKVVAGVNTVDTSFFARETEKIRQSTPLHDGKKHLLSIGYLSRRKNIRQLIELVRELSTHRRDFVLDLIGDGDQRMELESMVKRYGIEDMVVFHGYLQKEELPAHMARASLFLFQTDFDIWGLVLNEAMAAGLPVICSSHAGASADLIREGETGFIMDFEQLEPVVARVNDLLNDPETCRRIGINAAGFISRFATLQHSADAFLRMLQR